MTKKMMFWLLMVNPGSHRSPGWRQLAGLRSGGGEQRRTARYSPAISPCKTCGSRVLNSTAYKVCDAKEVLEDCGNHRDNHFHLVHWPASPDSTRTGSRRLVAHLAPSVDANDQPRQQSSEAAASACAELPVPAGLRPKLQFHACCRRASSATVSTGEARRTGSSRASSSRHLAEPQL